MRRDLLQRRYRPSSVRLLFIGEAPPASGRFFYRQDSGLYRAIRDAFRQVDPAITDTNFLDSFQSAGCYLIDLCPYPVDHLNSQSRRAACLAAEPRLTRIITRLKPQAIATVVRSIRSNVERAASRSGWRGPLVDLPYPGRWVSHRNLFVGQLSKALMELDN